jgi:hypothetical protein
MMREPLPTRKHLKSNSDFVFFADFSRLKKISVTVISVAEYSPTDITVTDIALHPQNGGVTCSRLPPIRTGEIFTARPLLSSVSTATPLRHAMPPAGS